MECSWKIPGTRIKTNVHGNTPRTNSWKHTRMFYERSKKFPGTTEKNTIMRNRLLDKRILSGKNDIPGPIGGEYGWAPARPPVGCRDDGRRGRSHGSRSGPSGCPRREGTAGACLGAVGERRARVPCGVRAEAAAAARACPGGGGVLVGFE